MRVFGTNIECKPVGVKSDLRSAEKQEVKGKILLSCRDDIYRSQLFVQLSEAGITPTIVNNEMDLLLEVLQQDFQVVIYDLEI